jgi:hypothetical protein
MRQPGTRLSGRDYQTYRHIPAGSCVMFRDIVSNGVFARALAIGTKLGLALSGAGAEQCHEEPQLLSSLEAALPLESRIGPQLAAVLQNKIRNPKPLQRCQISQVFYTGDEGGIVCGLDLPAAAGKEVYLASITHLVFDPRLPLARRITIYQKHRLKSIRRGAAAN